MWLGLPRQFRQWSRKVAKMMNKFGVKVTELHEFANLLLRRRHMPVYNGLDFLSRNGNFTNIHSVAQVLHLMKTEEAFS
jgi:hypothetical protein